jgi:hypothetical protein
MRKLALAATIVLGVAAIAAPSLARPWADARLVMDIPNAGQWDVVPNTYQSRPDRSYLETAAPDDDCAFYSTDAQIANAALARTAITEDARFPPQYLAQVAGLFPMLLPESAGAATVTSNVVETSGPWPIRRLTYRAGDRVTHAAIQWRPGLQLIAMCARYQGAESESSRYDAIFRSIGHPNDAAWLEEARQQSQANAAQAAANEAAAAESERNAEAARDQRRERRGGRSN